MVLKSFSPVRFLAGASTHETAQLKIGVGIKCILFASIYFKHYRASARLFERLWLQRKLLYSIFFQSSSQLHFITVSVKDVLEVSFLPLKPHLCRGS